MSDKDITLDSFECKPKYRHVPDSEWRKDRNNESFDLLPGLDDLRKIKRYINQEYPDCEIMQVFGLNADTFLAIKYEFYCPVQGILEEYRSRFKTMLIHARKAVKNRILREEALDAAECERMQKA